MFPSPRARRPLLPLLCLGLAIVLAACPGRDAVPGAGSGESKADPAARSPGRVVIVGIDGADWRVIEPLAEHGKLPTFQRLLAEGSTGELQSMEPSASPSLWTTIATGVGPDRHGIHGFVVPAGDGTGPPARAPSGNPEADPAAAAGRRAGRDAVRPVTSEMRRAPAFWNILPRFGRRVGVVGWLVTWPAEPVDGFVVSSYLPYIYNWSTGRPLKGTIVNGIPRQTYPEGLAGEIDALKVTPAALDAALVARFYDPTHLDRLGRENRECVEGFLWSLACDETYRRVGLHLFERVPVDLFAVYFGGIDVASHRFWKFANPTALDYGVDRREAAVLGGVIDAYYQHVDRLVGEYLERLGPDDTLVVLSDHGFRPVLIPGRPTTSGHHRREGIVAFWGRGIRKGGRIEGARLVDVLPTILMFLEVPLALDLEGQPLRQALDPAFDVNHPPRFVDAYEAGPAARPPGDSDLDRNVLERLRSLGYIN